MVAYVLENQSLDGLINEDGYTDAIASVSINLYGFTGGVEDCFEAGFQISSRIDEFKTIAGLFEVWQLYFIQEVW